MFSKCTNAAMRPKVSLQLAILLVISIPVQCDFEFNDLKTGHNYIVGSVLLREVKCISILRPTNETAKQKSIINGITRRLIKEYSPEKYNVNQRPSVMSYTTEMYEKLHMDENVRKMDNCVFGSTVVMVSDSTNAQLVRLSENRYNFEKAFWLLLANRTDVTSLFANVPFRINTRFWILHPTGIDHFRVLEMGTVANRIGATGSYLFTKDGILVDRSKDFRSKMTGSILTVGTVQVRPFVGVNYNQIGEIASVTGLFGDIWNDLQEALKFNTVFVTPVPKDGTYGIIDQSSNWTRLYGLIVRKEVDVMLSPMAITETRSHVVDFLHAINKDKFKIFYKREEDKYDWFKVFRPLACTVWIVLIMWIVAGGAIAYFVSSVAKNFQQVKNDISLIYCMFFVLRTLCYQGLDQVPKPWAMRIFLITAYLHATLIITSYSASLTSVLTVKTPVEPFNTLPDILTTDYKLAVTSNTATYDFFAKSKDPIHREIYEKSIIKNQRFASYYTAMVAACESYKTCFFGTSTDVEVMYRFFKFPCVLLPLRSELSQAYKTILVAKHSQYREKLNQGLFRMIEHGLVNRYRLLYLPNSYETSQENEIGIGLNDVGAVFIYLIILQALSVGILILELMSRNYQRYKKEETHLREIAQPQRFHLLDFKE